MNFLTAASTCRDKSDFIYNKDFCRASNNTVLCRDNKFCIHKDLMCDGHLHCEDGSDENPETCSRCPREFGHPAGKSEFATMSCRHRFTQRFICSVPCDGVDDLCEDFSDEACTVSSVKFTLSFLLALVVLTYAVGELVFYFENMDELNTVVARTFNEPLIDLILNASASNDSGFKRDLLTFKRLHDEENFSKSINNCVRYIEQLNKKKQPSVAAKALFKLEYHFHSEDESATLICLKENLGTSEITQWFFGLLKPKNWIKRSFSSLQKELKQRFFKSSTKTKNVSNLIKNYTFQRFLVVLKTQLAVLIQIIFYFLDLIKDSYLLVILYQKVSLLRPFNSFEIQILFFTSLSIALPQICNFILMIYFLTSKKIHQISGFILSITFVIIPAVGLYLTNRFKSRKEIQLKETKLELKSICFKPSYYQSKVENWMFRSSVLKMIEAMSENTVQVSLLLFVILLKFSKTNTILGLENLFSGDELEYIFLSAIWSLVSKVIGEIKWQATLKNYYIPLKGKLILFVFFLIAIVTRTFAILLYFAPSMGLFNLLSHWKMGSLKPSTEEKVYSMTENGTVKGFSNTWEVMEDYTELTNWKLESYFKSFVVFIAVHFVIVIVIKCCLDIEFKRRKFFWKKIFHILTQLTCPTVYTDWDEKIISVEDAEKNWSRVCKEIKLLLFVFAFEHFMMCIPLWILSFNISTRNEFLNQFFPQVIEEQRATVKAFTLSIVCPILYFLIPFIQFKIFVSYHRFGHPWSRILNRETKNVEHENEEMKMKEKVFEEEKENVEMESLVRTNTEEHLKFTNKNLNEIHLTHEGFSDLMNQQNINDTNSDNSETKDVEESRECSTSVIKEGALNPNDNISLGKDKIELLDDLETKELSVFLNNEKKKRKKVMISITKNFKKIKCGSLQFECVNFTNK